MLRRIRHLSYKKAITARLTGTAPNIQVPAGGNAEYTFIRAMFMLLGKLAKMDGQVSTEEVRFASQVMKQLAVSDNNVGHTIEYFNQGSRASVDVLPSVYAMVQHMGRRSELTKLFIKTGCRACCVDGVMGLQQGRYLRDVAQICGFDKTEFQEFSAKTRILPGYDSRWTPSRVSQAYSLLQLSPEVEDSEIRQAYRRLVARYHPDKLSGQNATDDAMRAAQEQFAAIRDAYEILCGSRKIRT